MESSNPRASRWSDAPPAQDGNGLSTTDKRPPLSAAAEPPAKKSKVVDSSAQPPADGSAQDYTDASYAAYADAPAYGENRSAAAGQGYGGSSVDQTYGGAGGGNYGYGGGDQTYGSFAPGSAKGSGTAALFYKTKLCTKFKLGSCTFNERCHFAHGVEDLRKPPPGWEEVVKQGGAVPSANASAMPSMLSNLAGGAAGRGGEPPRRSNKPCRYYVDGNCPYGDRCTFSHGADDAQRAAGAVALDPSTGSGASNGPARSNFKTRICTRWEKGECMYGEKCHFAHGQADLRAPSYNSGTMTASTNYSDPNIMNQPPMSAPYGAYGSTGGNAGYTVPGQNLSSYGTMNVYGTAQDGTNGYSAGYGYWNQDGTNSTATPAGAPNTGYVQPNQATPWIPNYSVDGGYAKTETNPAGYYTQSQPQQPQNVPYYGSAPAYQDPASNPSYAPDASQPTYQADATKNGEAGGYYAATYPNQQSNAYPSQQVSGYQSAVYPNQQAGGYPSQQIVGTYPNQQPGYTGSYNAS